MTSLTAPHLDSPDPPYPTGGGHRLIVGLLAAAVVLAFADASVVVLALPAMYGEYETTIVGVSWVITAYALVLAVAGFALAALACHGRARSLTTSGPAAPGLTTSGPAAPGLTTSGPAAPGLTTSGPAAPGLTTSGPAAPGLTTSGPAAPGLTAAGLGLFGVASAGCAVAPGVGWLIVARGAQGLGGALLLVGALGVLRRLDPARGQRIWTLAGTAGLAVGPTLGGVLTDLFAWRTVFVVQAPVALLAVVVARSGTAGDAGPSPARPTGGPGVRSLVVLANGGLLFVSAALVGALFLAVILVIEVWQFTPVGGALVVSALPAGVLAVGRLRVADPVWRAAGGCLVLALGLAALALLPAASPWWAAAALAACGAGFGLVTGVLDIAADGTAALAIASRHAGLVLGLAVFAPLLATDLDRGAEQAALTGARTILDARLNLSEKISVARTLRDEVDRAPRGQMPDLSGAGPEVRGNIEAVLTRAFRTAFGVAGGLALLAAGPSIALARRLPRHREVRGSRPRSFHAARSRRRALAAIVAVSTASVGLLAAEAAAGGRDFGRYEARDPCRAPPGSYPGKGFDATVQRIVLSGLDGAACTLDVTREALVLSLDQSSGLATVDWDRATIEAAVRAGLVRAVDDAEDRGSVPGWAAGPLRELARRAPVDFALGTADVFRSGLDAFRRGLDGLRDLFR